MISSFIRFSGLDPNHENLNELDIYKIVNKNEYIDYELKHSNSLVRVYILNSTKSTGKDISLFASQATTKYSKVVIVKNSWSSDIVLYGAFALTYNDFKHDISEINKKYNIVVLKKDANLVYHKISKNDLPKINKTDILSKWLLLEDGDIITYTIYTNNGPYISKRVVIDKPYF